MLGLLVSFLFAKQDKSEASTLHGRNAVGLAYTEFTCMDIYIAKFMIGSLSSWPTDLKETKLSFSLVFKHLQLFEIKIVFNQLQII